MFEKLNIKEFGKNFFDNLNPIKAPYYSIVLACTISIVASCEYLNGVKWYSLFTLILTLLAVAIYFAARSYSTDKKEQIVSELRVARISGIAVALIGTTYASNDTKFVDLIFILVLMTAFIQVAYLMILPEKKILSLEEDEEKGTKVINITQMTLITNILLITFFTLSASLSIRYKVYSSYTRDVIDTETKFPVVKKFAEMDPNYPHVQRKERDQSTTPWYKLDYQGDYANKKYSQENLKIELAESYERYLVDSIDITESINNLESQISADDYSFDEFRETDINNLEYYKERLAQLKPRYLEDSLRINQRRIEIETELTSLKEKISDQKQYYEIEEIVQEYQSAKVEIARFIISTESVLGLFGKLLKSISDEGVEGVMMKLSEQFMVYLVSTIVIWALWLVSMVTMVMNVRTLKSE